MSKSDDAYSRPVAGYPSRRLPVFNVQVRFVARLIEDLERSITRLFAAPSLERIPLDRFKEVWDLPAYQLFCEGSYACGFVCNDYDDFFDLRAANADPRATLNACSFADLRHYLHTLQRAERWADGYSSPILEALASGSLTVVKDRFLSDETLVADSDGSPPVDTQDRALREGHDLLVALRSHRTITVDMQKLDSAASAGVGFDVIMEGMENGGVGFYDGKGISIAMRAIAGKLLWSAVTAEKLAVDVRPVSLTPASDPVLRRAVRLLSMVHELHKAGYQLLRISAGMAPSGNHWRCYVTTADNVAQNGWEIIDEGIALRYSTGDGGRFFGWDDAEGMDARRLAATFLDRFPEMKRKGAGNDWAYAGWFTSMLGAAENGELPIFFADYELKPVRHQMPPAPINVVGSQA
ncbi:hypothetical protein FSB08_32370 [Paraburkholderia sp. JPY432]|uniref:hypothetical protein n=1 Tax=Paraburkholderia youngii TaxID=2782701 RepID=UPI001595C024|nr:hypothetical protein [Paraburkholderia youngii]NVH77088.1 hypothetical protein [Paraburkholderia youngii]